MYEEAGSFLGTLAWGLGLVAALLLGAAGFWWLTSLEPTGSDDMPSWLLMIQEVGGESARNGAIFWTFRALAALCVLGAGVMLLTVCAEAVTRIRGR